MRLTALLEYLDLLQNFIEKFFAYDNEKKQIMVKSTDKQSVVYNKIQFIVCPNKI